MPKVKQSYSSKDRSILHEYTSKFTSTFKGELFCKVCDCIVKCNKSLWWIHTAAVQSTKEAYMKRQVHKHFLKTPTLDFAEKVTKAFLCADIPLHKLRNSHLSSLFIELGNLLPSKEKCCSKVEKLVEEEAL